MKKPYQNLNFGIFIYLNSDLSTPPRGCRPPHFRLHPLVTHYRHPLPGSAFHLLVVNNLEDRLNKGLVQVSDLMKKIKDKDDVDFSEVAKLFGLNAELLRDEWKYAGREPEDVELTVFASCPRIIATFPALSQLAVCLLLLPIGTATCECWNIRSQDYSFPGTFVPWTIRSRDRILRGKFIPLTTTVAIHRSLCT